MKRFRDIMEELGAERWALGFVWGGMDAVMDGASQIGNLSFDICDLQVDWVKMPRDCWMADPFVLDVTDTEILLLVEEMPYAKSKGIITLLHIDRVSMEITARKVLLELPTHLSFPAIWRKDGHIYVYPESAKSGRLDMYEYHPDKEELAFVQTICDDVVWDSFITEAFGEARLFTASKNDYQLDIYRWDSKRRRFVSDVVILSEKPNSRMGGGVFEYNNSLYYPAQDCSERYGGAIDIKRIKVESGKWKVESVKHLTSPHPKYRLGMHTMNEYKGVVVIDVLGYKYGWIGAFISYLVKIKKMVCGL